MDKKTVNKIIKNYLDELKRNNIRFEKAYLFGSSVRKTASENSDIDIALIFKKIEKRFELQIQLMRLRRKIDLRIEPHPIEYKFFNINNSLAEEILKHGVEINY